MTLKLVMPVLCSDLMMVCRCLICSVIACAECVLDLVFVPCVSVVQHDPKTKRGIGGIKILPLFFAIVSRQLTNLTCSLRMVSGVNTASPRRCHPPSPGSLTTRCRPPAGTGGYTVPKAESDFFPWKEM